MAGVAQTRPLDVLEDIAFAFFFGNLLVLLMVEDSAAETALSLCT